MTLTEVHQALVDKIRVRFPKDEIPLIECYPELGRSLPLPAIVIELAEFDPASADGTGRLLLDARFEARVIVDASAASAHVTVRSIAARLGHAIADMVRIAPGLGINRVMTIGEDAFRPDLDGYLCWSGEWACEIPLGSLAEGLQRPLAEFGASAPDGLEEEGGA